MIIRQAESRDATAISAFWVPLVRDTIVTFSTDEKTPADVAEMIDARHPAFVVAEMDGEVVGFASFAQFRGGPGYRHSAELTIILSDRARGQGVGRRLIVALEQIGRAQDIHILVAGVSAENTGAVEFHRACGFVETGRMPEVGRKFGRWHDLVLMQKTL